MKRDQSKEQRLQAELSEAQVFEPTHSKAQRASLSRRGLLKGLAGVTGLWAAEGALRGSPLAPLAFAQGAGAGPRVVSEQDRYYIFCYFSGGWDILLGLDPRDPRDYGEDRIRVTLTQPAYDQLTGVGRDIIHAPTGVSFGPHIGGLLSYADQVAVVRGMSMDTLSHSSGRRRFLTGKSPSGLQARGSSVNTWLSAHLGAQEPIPNLAIRVESFNDGQLPTFADALAVSNSDDLIRTLTPADPALPPLVSRQIQASLSDAAACAEGERSAFWRAAEVARQKALDMTAGGFAQRFDLRRPEFAELRQRHAITNLNDSVELRGALAVQAICSGMTRCVNVEVANGLDTHFDNWTTEQGARQEQGFNVVSRIADDLASREYYGTGRSWLDHTVIVGFSEFSRTPLLNDNGGRDHALTNAAFLLGAKINGGHVIGSSSPLGMQPMAVNLQTGQAVSNPTEGEVVRPEHILQTLYSEVGIQEADVDLRVPPLPTLLRS